MIKISKQVVAFCLIWSKLAKCTQVEFLHHYTSTHEMWYYVNATENSCYSPL